MNPRTIRRAAERAALKAQKSQPRPIAAELQTASPAQFAANRANAQLSCGPVSPEGKAISARNHTLHGLTAQPTGSPFQVLAGEDQAEYDRVVAAYQSEWKPATATESDLVERMTVHAWLRRRAQRLQDNRLALGMNEPEDFRQFECYSRYYNSHLRAYNKAFADLMRLRAFQMRQLKDEALLQERAQDLQIRFESQQRKAEEHAARMESLRLKQETQKQRLQRVKATGEGDAGLTVASGTGSSASAS